MNCLWLTRKYPVPANSGELIYSGGMIRALAASGVALTVIAHDNDEAPVAGGEGGTYLDESGVRWVLGAARLGSRLPSLLTSLPADAWRLKGGGLESSLAKELAEGSWDAIVIDHAAMGWALPQALQARARGASGASGARGGDRLPPVLAYLSHNHEARVRREVAAKATGPLPKRLALRYDAAKFARLEERLCAEADLVSAITETEVAAYREGFPQQRYLCLSPGYDGPTHRERRITAETPRRVVMSGSFEWIAKRENLEIFLSRAAGPLAEAGIELQIVGKAEEDFRERMRRRHPGVDFVGRVPEMSPYLLDARMGLVVEELGGGFKLKTLEYVFHGLPLAGLEHAVDGLPLRSPEDLLLAPDLETLLKGIVEIVDDHETLDRMRARAIAACEAAFRWEDRGFALREALEFLINKRR